MLYLAKLSFKTEGAVDFSDEGTLKEFVLADLPLKIGKGNPPNVKKKR